MKKKKNTFLGNIYNLLKKNIIGIFFLIIFVILVCLWNIEEQKIINKKLEIKVKLEAIKDNRTVFISIGGGLLASIGLYLAWRRTKALDKQNETNQANLEVLIKKNEQEKLDTANNLILQQFSKASELLANEDSISARLSGIYLFEKIMNENKDYHWQIVELLTAYVREKRNNKKYDMDFCKAEDHPNIEIDEKTKTDFYTITNIETEKKYIRVPVEKDIQAILTVLGRRNIEFEIDPETGDNLKILIEKLNKAIENNDGSEIKIIKLCLDRIKRLDLSDTNLYKANLSELHLEHINCIETQFTKANCYGAIFTNADCYRTNFIETFCYEAIFLSTYCRNSNFTGANCIKANFTKTICYEANFTKTICNIANFTNADCFRTNFKDAECINVNFTNTACIGTIFTNAN